MIDIAAHEAGQRHFLTEPGDRAKVPLGTGKGALAVLSGGANDRQAVGLQFKSAGQAIHRQAAAVIDRGQGQRHQSLRIVNPHGLGGPASDAEIAVFIDPLDIERGAQPVIAADIIAAQEGAVRRQTAIAGQTPFGRELELAVRLDIAAPRLLAGGGGVDRRAERDQAASRGIAGNLECAEVGQVPVFGGQHRQ